MESRYMVKFKIIESKSEKKEKKIQSEIVRWLKDHGYSVDVITKGLYGNNGISDIIAVKQGKVAFIEVKRPGKKPTKLQELYLKEKQRHGAISFIAYCIDDVKRRLQ